MAGPEYTFDAKEMATRILKYIFEGLIVAIAAYLIPGKKIAAEEIITIGLIASATFSLFDAFLPSVAQQVRQGSAMGVGLNLVGGVTAGLGR